MPSGDRASQAVILLWCVASFCRAARGGLSRAAPARFARPVIGIFGNDDENPSPADVDDLDAALNDAGVEHAFHRYDGAGHGFQNFADEDRYRKEAAEDSWRKVLAFFDKNLK